MWKDKGMKTKTCFRRNIQNLNTTSSPILHKLHNRSSTTRSQSSSQAQEKLEGNTMMTQTQSFLISLAIIIVSFIFLAPRILNATQPVVLLNQTVVLTGDNYETQYNLALNQSDQLNIQLSGGGNLVDLMITQGSSSNPLVDQQDNTILGFTWTVPQTGSYVFTINADNPPTTATITVTETWPPIARATARLIWLLFSSLLASPFLPAPFSPPLSQLLFLLLTSRLSLSFFSSLLSSGFSPFHCFQLF